MKITILQREIIIWTIFFFVVGVTGACYINQVPNEHPGIIRLHIIANSNRAEDQALKLKVRDQVLSYMQGQESEEATRAYIKSSLRDIELLAEEIIAENGYSYGARAKLGVTFIPEKTYENMTLPAGNYEALNITLGSGKGENWWCVIFPQLCLIGEDQESEKVILKSKVLQLVKGKEKGKGAKQKKGSRRQ